MIFCCFSCRYRTAGKSKGFLSYLSETIEAALPKAKRIILIEDSLITHRPSSWYANFPSRKAKYLVDYFDLFFIFKHDSWLNMAEIELHSLSRQCLNRRIDNIETMKREVELWTINLNNAKYTANWQCMTEDARIKLNQLYMTLQS